MSDKKDVFQNQKELKKQKTTGVIKPGDKSVTDKPKTEKPETEAQDVGQLQENLQKQNQVANISQDVDEEQIQTDFKGVNLLINSESLLPDLTSGVLKGVVFNQKDKLALAKSDVKVYFGSVGNGKNPILVTKTNSFGEFKVEDLPAGFYSIETQKENYLPSTLHNFRVRAGQESIAQVPLKSLGSVNIQSIPENNVQDVDQKQINQQKQNQVSTLTQDVKLHQKQVFNPTVNIAIITGGSDVRDLTVGKIIGTILNKESGLPLTNAKVEVYFGAVSGSPILEHVTDEEGNYVFEDLPSGFYSLKVSDKKRSGIEVPNVRVRPAKENMQDIKL